jgi:hypothetical protein
MTRLGMHFLVSVLALAFAAIGCTGSSSGRTEPADLRSLVGQAVHLEGRFAGPGKLADLIIVPGGAIYLTGIVDNGGAKIEYGDTIVAEGVLGYQHYPHAPTSQEEVQVAPPPDHFYILNAKVRVVHPAGGT